VIPNLPAARLQKSEGLFAKIGCAACHVERLTTAPSGTKINGGTYTIPVALGSVTFHLYGDFLMHDVGTGNGILQATREHYGNKVFQMMSGYLSKQDFESSRNKIRTEVSIAPHATVTSSCKHPYARRSQPQSELPWGDPGSWLV
jgi:hypothetical protein